MKRSRNKGFSLIELIVAFAIFSIVGIAIVSFMSFSSRLFENSNRTVKLQYEQQIVVNHLRESVLATSRGIYFAEGEDSSDLVIISDSENVDSPYRATKYTFSEGDKTLSLSEGLLKKIPEEDGLSGIAYTDGPELLSDRVDSFSVDLSEVNNAKVSMDLSFSVGDKTVEVSPVVALRRFPLAEAEYEAPEDELADTEYEPTKVLAVSISRDGRVFSGSAMDELQLAGTANASTTAEYTAIVKKNSNYKGEDYTGNVEWMLDSSSLKDGYGSYISLTPKGNNAALTVKAGAADYTKEGYVLLRAVSRDQTDKYATLRVRITTGGVYPKELVWIEKAAGSYDAMEQSDNSLTWNFGYRLTYTDGQVYTGTDVFDKITLVSCKDGDGKAAPTGMGFYNTTFDGKFKAVKSMANKTYTIELQTKDNGVEGEPVKCIYQFTVPGEENFPGGGEYSAEYFTYQYITVDKTDIKRGKEIPLEVEWKYGTPKIGVTGVNYNTIFYEWELVPAGDNWDNSEDLDRTEFSRLVEFVRPSTGVVSYSPQKVVTDSMYAKPGLMVKSYLNWDKSFDVEVRVTVRLYNNKYILLKEHTYTGNEYYFRKFSFEIDGYYLFPILPKYKIVVNNTSNKSEAYVATETITFKPVKLELAAVDEKLAGWNAAGGALEGIYNSYSTVGLGVRTNEAATTYFDRIAGKNVTGSRILYNYFKVFRPEFTGIHITNDTYSSYLGRTESGAYRGVELKNGTTSTLRPYYYNAGSKIYWNTNVTGFDTNIAKSSGAGTASPLIYLKLTPADWYKKTATFPVGTEFSCIVTDSHGNRVQGLFNSESAVNNKTYNNKVVFEYTDGKES